MNSYQLGKELGQGAWGKTYLAVNPLTKQKFAIKEFKIEYKVQVNIDSFSFFYKLTNKNLFLTSIRNIRRKNSKKKLTI